MTARLNRRDMLKVLGGAAAAAAVPAPALASSLTTAELTPRAPVVVRQMKEIVHWSWLTASDGEVWQQMIDSFNTANASNGLHISLEVVPDDQYGTKVLAAAATGNAPDFGWGTGGLRADWVKKGVVVPLDDVMPKAGLDLSDFDPFSLQSSRYGGALAMIPMDAMSLQVLLNVDHARAAGLDPANPPTTGDQLIDWAQKMTQRDGDKVTRSGWLMTGSGVQPTVTWGIIAHQLGFRRASDDLKQAAVNPDAGKAAAQWVLDLYDKHRVSTRDITDRYKAFGTGQGSMFLTGPWTLNGYMQQGVNFSSFQLPQVGKDRSTYYELGGLEMYVQADKSRYDVTAQAIKWLSDNSFLWTTKGRGASLRKSILEMSGYREAGHPWQVRGAFVEGMKNAVVGEVPVTQGSDFTIYTGSGFAAKTMDQVWAGNTKIDDAIAQLQKQWQMDLDEG